MNLENPPLIKVIYTLLSNDVVLRDDWMGVIRQIHSIEMIAKGIKKEDYFDILFDGKYDSFSNVHTIKRVWQKVQEIYPQLRGVEWEKRQIQGGQFASDKSNDFYSQLSLFSEEQLNEFAKIDYSKFYNFIKQEDDDNEK